MRQQPAAQPDFAASGPCPNLCLDQRRLLLGRQRSLLLGRRGDLLLGSHGRGLLLSGGLLPSSQISLLLCRQGGGVRSGLLLLRLRLL